MNLCGCVFVHACLHACVFVCVLLVLCSRSTLLYVRMYTKLDKISFCTFVSYVLAYICLFPMPVAAFSLV